MTLKIKRGPAGDPPSGTPEPVPAPSSGPTPRVRPLVAPRAPSSAKNRAKVLLSVLDGKIEWEKMTAESRKQFEELFKDREFLSQFGLTGKEKMFDPEQIKMLYDGISTIYRTVVAFFLGWPEPVLKMLAYTDEQKEMLAQPTANLANKFAPAFLQKHQELLVWGAIFGSITQKNFLEASAEAKKLAAKKPRPTPPTHIAPAHINPPLVVVSPANRPAPIIEVPFSMPSNGEPEGFTALEDLQ